MCTKHTNIFACGHETSYLLAHSRFIMDPYSCPQLSNVRMYVDQGCGSCDWEEGSDDGASALYKCYDIRKRD